jgi:integrase
MRLTDAKISELKARETDYRISCDKTLGLSIKVTPTGRKSFTVDGRIKGAGTRRITLGTYPSLLTSDARDKAQRLMAMMHRGDDPKDIKLEQDAIKVMQLKTLGSVFTEFLAARSLKQKTVRDYRNTMNSVFAGWLDHPINKVTRNGVSELHAKTKVQRGQPTAVKAFRILSSIMNYAKADDIGGVRLLTDNPVDVLKEKRVDRRVKPRERYLDENEIEKLMHFDLVERTFHPKPTHGVTEQGMNYVMLVLFTGMRKSEVCNLRWEDIDFKKKTLVARDTKNGSNHYVPMSDMIEWKLKAQKKVSELKASPWVFPRKVGEGPMTEPKSQLAKICEAVGFKFMLHDLRRTFATHATEAGVSYDQLQKALNHKSGAVTSGYIIKNLDMMRPVFNAIFESYSKMYSKDVWEEYSNPEAHEEIDPQSIQPTAISPLEP